MEASPGPIIETKRERIKHSQPRWSAFRPNERKRMVAYKSFWGTVSFACWIICGPAYAEVPGGVKEKVRIGNESIGEPNAQVLQRPSPKSLEKSSLIVTREYLIGPEDILDVTVWRNQELSKTVAVRPDGRISLPLIGEVVAVGRTPEELTNEISKRLHEFKENPNLAIVVHEVNSYAIFVLGEVAKPGKYPLKIKTTLLQGISIAGGFTSVAARNKLVVFRFRDNGAEKIKASYDDIVLRDGIHQNIELKPGDTIVVPSETMVMIP